MSKSYFLIRNSLISTEFWENIFDSIAYDNSFMSNMPHDISITYVYMFYTEFESAQNNP